MVGTAQLAWIAIEEYYTSKKEKRCKDMIFNGEANNNSSKHSKENTMILWHIIWMPQSRVWIDISKLRY